MDMKRWDGQFSGEHGAFGAFARFLTDDPGTRAHGFTRPGLIGLAVEPWQAHPEYFDWLLPADQASHPQSTAPRLSFEEALKLLRSPLLEPALRANYVTFVRLHGLVIDHHGWLYPATGREEQHLRDELVRDPLRGARALRFLTLAGMEGYSRTGVPASVVFADGLVERLEAEWRRVKGPHVPFPHEWAAARLL